jgi:hypothetical protein
VTSAVRLGALWIGRKSGAGVALYAFSAFLSLAVPEGPLDLAQEVLEGGDGQAEPTLAPQWGSRGPFDVSDPSNGLDPRDCPGPAQWRA